LRKRRELLRETRIVAGQRALDICEQSLLALGQAHRRSPTLERLAP
jgi:hypothetical protein